MKNSKLEPLYLFLSLVLLGFSAFVYLTYNRSQQTPVEAVSTSLTASSDSNQTEAQKEKVDYSQIQAKLNEISQNPSAEAINNLKTEVEALEDSAEKASFLDTLTSLELDLTTLASIEENLTLAEQTAIADYFSAAQTGIDSLTSENKKTELQNRLNTLYTNLTGMAWSGQ